MDYTGFDRYEKNVKENNEKKNELKEQEDYLVNFDRIPENKVLFELIQFIPVTTVLLGLFIGSFTLLLFTYFLMLLFISYNYFEHDYYLDSLFDLEDFFISFPFSILLSFLIYILVSHIFFQHHDKLASIYFMNYLELVVFFAMLTHKIVINHTKKRKYRKEKIPISKNKVISLKKEVNILNDLVADEKASIYNEIRILDAEYLLSISKEKNYINVTEIINQKIKDYMKKNNLNSRSEFLFHLKGEKETSITIE